MFKAKFVGDINSTEKGGSYRYQNAVNVIPVSKRLTRYQNGCGGLKVQMHSLKSTKLVS